MAGFYSELHVSTMTGTLRNITPYLLWNFASTKYNSIVYFTSAGNKDLIKNKLSPSEAAVG